MAQAARLSLRLQKELKLLLSDPPPGAAFPHLSSSSSLSSIIAQIQGPDETVYAGGIFTVKIEIPDRYPFQPPCVTFVTPIYHPNIDTGGRICLDILNLPPKGAWQPSLNISTVLTSIGLLLSEPNPDDGLMCEASREYKYNRREFDRKAGDMTEKYAKAAAASGSSVCDGELQSLASSNALEPGPEVDTTRHESKHQATESVVQLEVKTSSNGLKHEAIPPVLSHKNVIGTSRKLSLESSVPSDGRGAHKKGREVPKDKMEVEETEKLLKDSGSKCNLSQEKLCGSRRKLSLGPLSQSQEKSDNVIKMDQCPSIDLPNIRVPNSGSVLSLSDNCYKQRLHLSQDSILPDENINLGSKKSRQFGNNQISGSFRTSEVDENKDEMIVKLPASDSNTNVLNEVLPAAPALGSAKNTHMIDGTGNASCDSSRKKRLCLTGKKFSLDFRGSSQTQEKDDKENVAPQMSKYNGLGSKNAHEKAAHKKLVTAQSEDNNSNMHLHYHSNKHHQDFRAAENQHQHYTDATTTTNQKKAEEPSRHEADSVIVLDSEDSDEEKTARVKFKPMLARKLLGRWRVRT